MRNRSGTQGVVLWSPGWRPAWLVGKLPANAAAAGNAEVLRAAAGSRGLVRAVTGCLWMHDGGGIGGNWCALLQWNHNKCWNRMMAFNAAAVDCWHRWVQER